MDPYKSLLASASREHVRRQSALQSPLVGNVFLPAIQSPKRRSSGDDGTSPTTAASALSMQHLKVIEQCIQAENRREAQLAQCASVRERRHLTRKFQAQRTHERELIEALMVGRPAAALELELLDFDPNDSAPSVGRMMTMNATASMRDASMGLTASVSSPDRVFRKATAPSTFTTSITAKPHARKKFTLPECQGSPGKKVIGGLQQRYPSENTLKAETETAKVVLEPASLPKKPKHKMSASEPLTRKRSPSRSASPARSGSTSLTQTGVIKSKQTDSLKKRDLKDERNARIASTTRVPPLTSLPRPPTVRIPGGASALYDESRSQVEALVVTNFDGVTSFAEARQLALQAAGIALPEELTPSVEKETQTSSRPEEDTKKWAVAQQWPLETMKRSVSDDTMRDGAHNITRPHSSPILRSMTSVESLRNAETSDETNATSSCDEHAAEPEVFCRETDENRGHSNEDGQLGDEDAALSSSTSNLNQNLGGIDDSGDQEGSSAHEADELFTRTLGAELEILEDTLNNEVAHELQTDLEEEDLDEIDPESDVIDERPPKMDETELETDVAEVLFDLVDLVVEEVERLDANDSVELEREEPENTIDAQNPSPPVQSARSAALSRAIGPLIRVQALFRGHRARRAFRLALYQEALRGGMLGAMPGTTQGNSGWYQDPKSLVAYYFEVDGASGEWLQRREHQCRRLVLSPFEMRVELDGAVVGSRRRKQS